MKILLLSFLLISCSHDVFKTQFLKKKAVAGDLVIVDKKLQHFSKSYNAYNYLIFFKNRNYYAYFDEIKNLCPKSDVIFNAKATYTTWVFIPFLFSYQTHEYSGDCHE